jgi:hypothetical protein
MTWYRLIIRQLDHVEGNRVLMPFLDVPFGGYR